MVWRDDKRFSTHRNDLVLQQLVYAVTAKKYKGEMEKSSLKWNSLCGVLGHNLLVIYSF